MVVLPGRGNNEAKRPGNKDMHGLFKEHQGGQCEWRAVCETMRGKIRGGGG